MPTATADIPLAAASGTLATTLPRRVHEQAHRRVPSASFTAFRVAFGLVAAGSMLRLPARGWVDQFYLAPQHHLTYAGFDWVRPLPAPLMHAHVVALAVLGVAIAGGYRTRLTAGLFAVGFAYLELIDAALYLNHYWFVTLTAVVLTVVPGPDRESGTVPVGSVWMLRFQLGVVYVFAGLAKLNPDWLLDGQPMHIWLSARTDRPLVGPWLDEPALAVVLSWAGALFDLTIVGWLLWRRSRPFAYVAVICFHVATAMLFQIGVFPWVMIALTPVFFEPDWPRRAWARVTGRPWHRREPAADGGPPRRWGRSTGAAMLAIVAINLVLPLRHYAADGNVRFNDDGYYLSWRVMLTERAGFVAFDVSDPASGETWRVRPTEVLAEWQAAQVTRRPDLILTTAHIVAQEAADAGHPGVRVRADAWVAFNGRPHERWIDPTVDLAALDHGAPATAYVLPIATPDDP